MIGRNALSRLAALALASAICIPAAQARIQVEGVEFASAQDIDGTLLDLEGTAVFTYLLFKVYAAALYLPPKASDADVLSDDVARRLEVVYLRDIDADDLAKAANSVLEKSMTPAEMAGIMPRLDRLHGWFEDVSAGDRVALSYAPNRGTTLEVNEHVLGTVPGADFARAYFSIWLGEVPIDEDLRAALLAGNERDDASLSPSSHSANDARGR